LIESLMARVTRAPSSAKLLAAVDPVMGSLVLAPSMATP
jgi:hypothetical protein